MKKNEQLIGEIMLDHLPKNILGALRVMAALTYPISDRRSFLAELETLVKDPQNSPPSEQLEALHLIRGTITALDFPILTPASGLEKTFAHLSNRYWEDFGLDLDIPGPKNFVERPAIDHCRELMNKFPGACGQQACEVFQQLVREHGEFNARVAAEAVGRSCR